MLFNSYEFILAFLPLTWIAWRLACYKHKTQLALCVLTFASIFFYSWWNPPFVLLLLMSIGVNFIIGNKLQFSGGGGGKQKFILVYWDFYQSCLNRILQIFQLFYAKFLFRIWFCLGDAGYFSSSRNIFLYISTNFMAYRFI